jgi:hypothetical protein
MKWILIFLIARVPVAVLDPCLALGHTPAVWAVWAVWATRAHHIPQPMAFRLPWPALMPGALSEV